VLGTSSGTAERFVKLALDPSEGRATDWPLRVESGNTISGDDAVVVSALDSWPDANRAAALNEVAKRGGSVILFLRPGLEETWTKLPDAQRQSLGTLLPGTPLIDAAAHRPHRAAPPAAAQTLLHELLDPQFQLGAMTTQRLVPFDPRGDATMLLAAVPIGDGRPHGLLYRHRLGAGNVYTLTTLPDPQFSTLATHPVFLPMLVRICLPDAVTSTAQNLEIGDPLKLTLPSESKLTLTTPRGESFVIDRAAGSAAFTYAETAMPGLYRWTNAAAQIVGMANVQLPAEEGTLTYRETSTVLPGDSVIIAKSLANLRAHLADLTQPTPRWSPLIAGVLLLLCFEVIVGNSSRLWKLWTR
jgi:hypothetical protein